MSVIDKEPYQGRLIGPSEVAKLIAERAMQELAIDKTKSGITHHDVRMAAELSARLALEFYDQHEPLTRVVEGLEGAGGAL